METVFEEREGVMASNVGAGGLPDSRSIEDDATARRDFYGFLAAVHLRPPEADCLRQMVEPEFLATLSSLFGATAVAALSEFAAAGEVDHDLASLEQEYMALFAVPTGRYVTPFEDVYRGITRDGKQERGPLLGECAIAVRRIYRATGAQMDSACKELPTHIGVELSFMSFLCAREAEALREGQQIDGGDPNGGQSTAAGCYRALQSAFLREHLNNWFPQLSSAIQGYAKSTFYKGLAVLTEEFLAWDEARLERRCGSRHDPAA